MAGIEWVATLNDSPLQQSLRNIEGSVKKTSRVIEQQGGSIDEFGAVLKRVFNILDQVGKNFNVEGVGNQIVALTKVIRDNEGVLTQSKDKLVQWAEQAKEAQKTGDKGLFDAITNDIKTEIATMENLIKETNDYKMALNEIKAINGIYSTGEKAPMLFNTQEEFEHVERLKTGISELISTIANFNGTENDLQGLRLELSGMQEELRLCELNAAEAAAKLGDGGRAAADASVKFFTLNKAVEEQTGVAAEMANKLNAAATELENAKAGGDLSAIDDAQIKYNLLSESLQDAKMNLINLQTEQKKASESFKGSTMNNLRMELRQATVEIADLTILYRNMTAEERNSAAGRELQQKLLDLTQKAGDMRDAMGDASRAIASVASDTHNFDAVTGGLNVVQSTFGAVTGAAAMFGAKEEELAAIQTKLQASLAISNALSVVQNNLQKESALMIGVTSVQKKALLVSENLEVAAKGKNIIVTKAAMVAQAAFNAVAKANPYVLLAGAIISVVGALAIFVKGSKDAEKAEKQRQDAMEKAKESAESYRNALSSSYANMMSKYSELRREWQKLSSDHQKTKWIKDNKKAFEELGLSVGGIKSAEDVFRNNTKNVVDSFKRRAEAAALAAKMTELYRQQMDLEQKYTERHGLFSHKEGDKVTTSVEGGFTHDRGSNNLYNGGKYKYNPSSGTFTYTTKGAQDANRRLTEQDATLKQINDDWKSIGIQIDDIDGKLKKLGDTTTTKGGGGGGSGNKTDQAAKQLQDRWKQEEAIADLEEKARRARTAASIAGIQNQAERERAERDVQYQQTLEDLKSKEEDIYKTIYEQRKHAYETANKDKKYESTASR